MSRREAVLSRVRNSLGVAGADGERRRAVEARIRARQRHRLPDRVAGRSPEQLARLFRGFLEAQSATVMEVVSDDEVPGAVAQYLRANNLPARVRAGTDGYLASLPWGREPALGVMTGRAGPGDEVGLSHAVAGVAETGTLVLASGADNPVTINFLPETHIVVVEARDIVGPYEDAWDKLRARFGERVLPRTINMISGPSRTGDIGGRLVMGAHGPRRMCVVIVTG
jgi:L-lactate dehydrogenase complex protein LldG